MFKNLFGLKQLSLKIFLTFNVIFFITLFTIFLEKSLIMFVLHFSISSFVGTIFGSSGDRVALNQKNA